MSSASTAIPSRSRRRWSSGWPLYGVARTSCWSAAAATRPSTCWCARLPRRRGRSADLAADLRHVRGVRAACRTRAGRGAAGRRRGPSRLDADGGDRGAGPPGQAGLRLLAEQPDRQRLPIARSQRLASALSGRALVVVDEAYGEFACRQALGDLLRRAFRTSRCCARCRRRYALAGARIGCLIAATRADPRAARDHGAVPAADALASPLRWRRSAPRWKRRVARRVAERRARAAGVALAALPGVRRYRRPMPISCWCALRDAPAASTARAGRRRRAARGQPLAAAGRLPARRSARRRERPLARLFALRGAGGRAP
jgi:hypothetical protein